MADLQLQEVWSDRETAYFLVPQHPHIASGDRLYISDVGRVWFLDVTLDTVSETVSVERAPRPPVGPSGWTLVVIIDPETGKKR